MNATEFLDFLEAKPEYRVDDPAHKKIKALAAHAKTLSTQWDRLEKKKNKSDSDKHALASLKQAWHDVQEQIRHLRDQEKK